MMGESYRDREEYKKKLCRKNTELNTNQCTQTTAAILDLSPLMTLGQEMRLAYATAYKPMGAKGCGRKSDPALKRH